MRFWRKTVSLCASGGGGTGACCTPIYGAGAQSSRESTLVRLAFRDLDSRACLDVARWKILFFNGLSNFPSHYRFLPANPACPPDLFAIPHPIPGGYGPYIPSIDLRNICLHGSRH